MALATKHQQVYLRTHLQLATKRDRPRTADLGKACLSMGIRAVNWFQHMQGTSHLQARNQLHFENPSSDCIREGLRVEPVFCHIYPLVCKCIILTPAYSRTPRYCSAQKATCQHTRTFRLRQKFFAPARARPSHWMSCPTTTRTSTLDTLANLRRRYHVQQAQHVQQRHATEHVASSPKLQLGTRKSPEDRLT